MTAELKHFSLAIVKSSILKHKAIDSQTVLEAIELEGRAAVNFLFKYLIKSEVVDLANPKSMKLLEYYYRLERLLNISDEIWDSRSDKKAGIIKVDLGLAYYTNMGMQFMKALASAWTCKPLLFSKHFFSFAHRAVLLELRA